MCLVLPKKFLQASEVEKSRKIQVRFTVKLRNFYQYFYVKKSFSIFHHIIRMRYRTMTNVGAFKSWRVTNKWWPQSCRGVDELFSSGHESEVRVRREISRQDEGLRLPRVKVHLSPRHDSDHHLFVTLELFDVKLVEVLFWFWSKMWKQTSACCTSKSWRITNKWWPQSCRGDGWTFQFWAWEWS